MVLASNRNLGSPTYQSQTKVIKSEKNVHNKSIFYNLCKTFFYTCISIQEGTLISSILVAIDRHAIANSCALQVLPPWSAE